MVPGARVLLAALLLAAIAAACGGDSGPPSREVFVEPPWDGAEQFTYELFEGEDHHYGTCNAETRPGDDQTEIIFDCFNDAGDFDDRWALVDSETLRPERTERTLYDVDEDETTVVTNIYRDDEVQLDREIDGDLTNSVTRDLPERDDPEDPEPGYYDDNTILWLVRGIDLKQGYDSAFHDINAAAGVHIVKVRLRIDGEETVEVPAGTFETWRMRMDSETSSQRLWVAKDPPHYVVKARFEDITHELTAID